MKLPSGPPLVITPIDRGYKWVYEVKYPYLELVTGPTLYSLWKTDRLNI